MKSSLLTLFFFIIGFTIQGVTLSGYIKDSSTGEGLMSVSIYVHEQKTGVVTDANGYFSISLSPAVYTFRITSLGYTSIEEKIDLSKSKIRDFKMTEDQVRLQEVVITANDASQRIKSPQMGVERLPISEIKRIPAFMGEVDVIKAIQLLPGVQSVSEGTSAFSVRGGTPDQNLILLDGAPVYNASHLMGFFSVFNNDIVKDASLYKGDIPATYGGRLSSLMEVSTKDGNDQRFAGQGGLGLISSRLLLEGPLVKEELTAWVAGRMTYADLFLPLVSKEMSGTKLNFFDLNAKINWKISAKHKLSLSGYFGQDNFKMSDFVDFRYANQTATLKWSAIVHPTFYIHTSFTGSWYNYNIDGAPGQLDVNWKSAIEDYSFRNEYTWLADNNNELKFGFTTSYKHITPGNAFMKQEGSNLHINISPSHSLESSLFISNQQKLGPVTLRYGLRLSMFNNIGPRTEILLNQYYQKTDSVVHNKGEFYNTYFSVEPRVGLAWSITDDISIKAAYARSSQYIHLMQTSSAGTPMDVWLASNPNIKPEFCDQLSAGYFMNLWKGNLSLSVEGYYKFFHNVVDFKDFATVILNKNIDSELRTGTGRAYGVELMLKKEKGNLTGWISYCYSRSLRTIEGVNQSKEYSSPSDRPHSVNVVLQYSPLKWLDLGFSWVYATGQPFSAPQGKYELGTGGNNVIPIYTGRNQYRLPDYHRMDFSATFQLPKGKASKNFQHDINLSFYNLYGRKNPWMVNFRTDQQTGEQYAEMTYLFSVVPAFTYNIKF